MIIAYLADGNSFWALWMRFNGYSVVHCKSSAWMTILAKLVDGGSLSFNLIELMG